MLFHRAENLIFASDPDHEGEAIAWHIIEMLQQQGALRDNVLLARVVFHEITEQSIKTALQAPREIDVNLVHAYLARRALDYLIAFNISPLVWSKLPSCRSAGRVQSAALSLICDREIEIDQFKPKEYWTMEAKFNRKGKRSNKDLTFLAHLTHFDSKKLTQFSITSGGEARDIEGQINSAEFQVISMKRNKVRRNPPTPYITSTLQQDAGNKLMFSVVQTMKVLILIYSYPVFLLDVDITVNHDCNEQYLVFLWNYDLSMLTF
jgi:DNA topoisomerase IA